MSILKNIRDPVHDLIRLECPIALKLLQTEAFQRLRRIRQLGLAYLTYPGAEHSRFTHSLGAHHLALKMVDSVNQNAGAEVITPAEREALGICGLIHDIGHGPFSHLFEKVTQQFIGDKLAHHEHWGTRILAEDPEIQAIVAEHPAVFLLVRQIFDKLHRPLVSDIISSELDADRFDYLLRDSLMTGVRYANLDLTWILRCLIPAEVSIHGNAQLVLALDATRGKSVVESYVIGRHFMYKHVYYHKTTRAAEQMLRVALQHATKEIQSKNLESPHLFFEELANKQPSVSQYIQLDDFKLLGFVDRWSEQNSQLGEICKRLRRHKIFKTIYYADDLEAAKLDDRLQRTRELAKKNGFDSELFVILDDPSDIALKSPAYLAAKGKLNKYQPLYFVEKSGTTSELAQSDTLVSNLSYRERRIYVPQELYADVKNVWDSK